ncbi:allatostatin-A receptor-like [Diadema antillarum]|uniref:allatostatin-A receptor-like n=1 Tax=Diadema antillarum TaxID=105358 RepID=UPI003A8C50BD
MTTPIPSTVGGATVDAVTHEVTTVIPAVLSTDGNESECMLTSDAIDSTTFGVDLPPDEDKNSSASHNKTDGHKTHEPEWEVMPLKWTWYIILQLISGILGTLGNLLVAVIIFQRRSSARSTDILIGSLAIADFLTSIFIIPTPRPIRVPNSWRGMLYCLILFPDIPLWTSVTASSYILMAISIDRFIAVVFPLQFGRIVTNRRVKFAIVFIWLAAFLSLSFSFFIIKVDESSHQCVLTISTAAGYAAMGYFWFSIRIIVPVLTMLITQSIIAVKLHIQSSTFKANETSAATAFHIVARNRVIGMMFLVIVVYIVCWLPNQVAFLGYIVGFVPPSYIGSPLHHVFTVLGFLNSCANPFIYLTRNPQFRIAFREFLTCAANTDVSVFDWKVSPANTKLTTAESRKTSNTRDRHETIPNKA